MSATTPLAATCTKCGRRVLEVRWDFDLDTLIGRPRLDPIELDAQQIVACVITGMPLWQVYEHAGRTVTSQRGPLWPREPMPGHIVPEHTCDRTWTGPAVILADPAPAATSATPPF